MCFCQGQSIDVKLHEFVGGSLVCGRVLGSAFLFDRLFVCGMFVTFCFPGRDWWCPIGGCVCGKMESNGCVSVCAFVRVSVCVFTPLSSSIQGGHLFGSVRVGARVLCASSWWLDVRILQPTVIWEQFDKHALVKSIVQLVCHCLCVFFMYVCVFVSICVLRGDIVNPCHNTRKRVNGSLQKRDK